MICRLEVNLGKLKKNRKGKEWHAFEQFAVVL